MDLFAEVFTRDASGILYACRAEQVRERVIGFRCICERIPLLFSGGVFYAEVEICECDRQILIYFGPGINPSVVFGKLPPDLRGPSWKAGKKKPQDDAIFLKACGIRLD